MFVLAVPGLEGEKVNTSIKCGKVFPGVRDHINTNMFVRGKNESDPTSRRGKMTILDPYIQMETEEGIRIQKMHIIISCTCHMMTLDFSSLTNKP